MSTAVREAFERWYSDDGESPATVLRKPDGGYMYAGAATAWPAWQAAWAASTASPPAGDTEPKAWFYSVTFNGAEHTMVEQRQHPNPFGLVAEDRHRVTMAPLFLAAPAAPAHASDCSTHNEPAYPNGPCDCSYTQSTLEEHAAALKAGDLMALAEEAGGNRTAENVVEMTREDLARIGTDFVRAAAPVLPDNDQACALFCAQVTDILDGKDDGTGGNLEPWGSVRRRLLALVAAPVAEPITAKELLTQVFSLCEETENKHLHSGTTLNDRQTGYMEGRRFEAKGIRRAIGTWFQDETNLRKSNVPTPGMQSK